MNHVMKWHSAVLGQQTVDALVRHNFSAYYCPNRKEAIWLIVMQLIPDGATIGVSGSRTVTGLGLVELLKKCRHEIFNCNPEALTMEAKREEWSRQLTCDIFLTGADAITLTGEIVNKDALDNRIAAMMFGSKKVIVVVGIDKIVRNVDEADARIKMYVAPMDNKQYESSNLCEEFDTCGYCNSPRRSCSITSVLHSCPSLTDIHVVILGEDPCL
jgi:hypothetical protein